MRLHMRGSKRTRVAALTLLACGVVGALAAAPAVAKGVTQRVRFDAGADSATLSGGVVRGDRDVYILKAGAGQNMLVDITSGEDNAVFQITGPGGRCLPAACDGDDTKTWSGLLPRKGDYRIIVGGTRGNAEYQLTVTIQNP